MSVKDTPHKEYRTDAEAAALRIHIAELEKAYSQFPEQVDRLIEESDYLSEGTFQKEISRLAAQVRTQ